MTFTTTANIECTIEQRSQIFHETHIAYRLILIHFTCSSSPQSKLYRLPTQTYHPRYLSSRTWCSDTV